MLGDAAASLALGPTLVDLALHVVGTRTFNGHFRVLREMLAPSTNVYAAADALTSQAR